MKRPLRAVAIAVVTFITPLAIADESASQLAEERGLNPGTTDTEESASQLAGEQELNPGTVDTEVSAGQLAEETGTAIPTGDNETSASDLAGERDLNPGTKDNEESAGALATERLGMDPTPTPSASESAGSSPTDGAVSGGATDSIFAGPRGVHGTVYAAVVQPDGKIVIGGDFNEVGVTPRSNLARLNVDGTLDTSFLPAVEDGVNGPVYALAVDSRGGILVGGLFNQAQGAEQRNFVRYLTTGRLDGEFGTAQSGPNGKVLAIAVQPTGEIIIGGQFSNVGNQPRRNIARISPNGSLGAVLNPEVSGTVASLVTLPGNKVLVGGEFQVSGGPNNVLQVDPAGAGPR